MTPYEILTLAFSGIGVVIGFLLVRQKFAEHEAQIKELRNDYYKNMREHAELSTQIWELAQAAGYERVEKNPQMFYRKKQEVNLK